MTDAEIDNLWLEAFKASSDDGKVRQRFAELCYQRGVLAMKEHCAKAFEGHAVVFENCAKALRAMN
jgi:hypothetical protein